MKVKFTKLAALLLAGVALFATGCTDYEVDIQKVDKKVDNLTTEVNGKIASLEQQIAGINATIATLETVANHDKDIKAVRDEMAALKTALQTEFNGKIDKAVADLTAEINKKVNQADYDVDKAAVEKALKDLNDALNAAKDRIKALEDAKFQDQIDAVKDRVTKCENLLAGDWKGKTVKETIDDLAKAVADLETDLNGKISALEVRVKANEDAIKEIQETVLPDLKKRVEALEAAKIKMEEDIAALQTGKLDKATFEAYVEETALTISAMQTAITNLQTLTAGFPEGTTIKQYVDAQYAEIMAKFNDYVLVKDFEAFKKIAATKAELEAVKAELAGRIKVCEDLLAGDWGGKTVQEYIDAKAKDLQDQVDNIVNNLIPELDKRVAALEKSVNEVILPQLEFALDYEGGLQAYIDDAANKAYEDAVAYTDAYMEYLIDQLNEILADIYDQLGTLNERVLEVLTRIQSIQYVPDYDDLKITTNMSYVYKAESLRARSENETEDEFVPVVFVDQPTQVTYQFLPAQYAQDVADGVEQFITDPSYLRFIMYLYGYADELTEDPFTREEIKELGITGILPFFDVRPVNTRDDDAPEAPQPAFVITSVDKVDTTTGEITFTVQPVNVASAQYAANGLKPMYNIGLTDRNGGYIQGWDPDAYWYYSGLFRAEDPVESVTTFTVPVWNLDDLKAYQDRTAFAAQLRMYSWQDYDSYEDYDWDNCDWDRYYEDWDYYPDIITFFTDYENELASPYNVLYPNVSEIKILPDPYKKEDNGSVRPFAEDEIWQTLPYSALRKDGDDAIGEKPEQDPKGYRIILDQAVPVVSIDGGAPMTLEAAAEAGYNVPAITTSFKEFEYYDSEGDELAEELKVNFVETPQVYAEFEMNEEVPASSRKKEVGDEIAGVYEFKSVLGAFEAVGYVEITKPEGSVNVSADIKWVYAQDADTDHERYYNDETAAYSHVAEPVTIDEESAATLESTLGITVADFDHKTPVKVVITDSEGTDVTETVQITAVTITEDGLTFDITGFEWDETYKVKADYDLDAALVTVNGTITTTDRKRDLIEINLGKHKFVLNGEEYDADSDTYESEPIEFQEPLFNKFVENGIINQGDPKDFEDADDFVGVDNNGKEGHLQVVTGEEGNSIYLVIADDNATIICTSPELKEIMGTEQFIYVTTYTGQKVKVKVVVDVDLPVYDFLHLSLYTFNKDTEFAGSDVVPFIQKYDFPENDGTVQWWTRVQPSYFNGEYNEFQEKISNRYALKQYDVAYINLAELAFNVVDKDDKIMDDAAIAAANLVVKFDYTDKTQGDKSLPKPSQTDDLKYYKDLWMGPTTFYYRTNRPLFIPVKGSLAILSGETEFPLVTRFDGNRNSVQYPEQGLDYTKYAVVRWTPFVVEKPQNLEIVLDENKIYREPLFKTINLKDQRPHDVSFSVIKDGEWVIGDAAPDATAASESNGFVEGVSAKDAYDIKAEISYDDVQLPVQLRKLLSVEEIDGVPYVVYDYTSEVEFQGVITIPVTVTLENPWQKELEFTYNVIIKGYNN